MMKKVTIQKIWWLPFLLFFDFLYYYFIKHITTPKTDGLWVKINWDGLLFVFLISLFSLACVYLAKSRLDRRAVRSIPVKYLQIMLYSFVLFLLITAGSQLLIEYAAGQRRNLEYVISNVLVFLFLHVIVSNAYAAVAYFGESTSLKQDLILTEKAKAESELRVLQQQMNPHFLFNNLNTLASLIPQDQNKAVHFTHGLSKIFRYLSQNGKKDIITLKEEIDFLANYLSLLEFRFGKAYRTVLQLDGIDTNRMLVVPLALQVIIENVVKHNSGSRTNPLKIEIFADDDQLSVKNEIRRKHAAKDPDSGIGLKNLQERYRLVTGQKITYGAMDGFFIVNLPLIKRMDDESLDH